MPTLRTTGSTRGPTATARPNSARGAPGLDRSMSFKGVSRENSADSVSTSSLASSRRRSVGASLTYLAVPALPGTHLEETAAGIARRNALTAFLALLPLLEFAVAGGLSRRRASALTWHVARCCRNKRPGTGTRRQSAVGTTAAKDRVMCIVRKRPAKSSEVCSRRVPRRGAVAAAGSGAVACSAMRAAACSKSGQCGYGGHARAGGRCAGAGRLPGACRGAEAEGRPHKVHGEPHVRLRLRVRRRVGQRGDLHPDDPPARAVCARGRHGHVLRVRADRLGQDVHHARRARGRAARALPPRRARRLRGR